MNLKDLRKSGKVLTKRHKFAKMSNKVRVLGITKKGTEMFKNIKNKLNKTLSYASLLALTIAAVYGGWSLIEQIQNVWILRGAVVLLAGFLVEQVLRLTRK